MSHSRLERKPRLVPNPSSGLVFYVVAGLFLLGTATVATLWTFQAVEVRRLEARVNEGVAKKKYAPAVAAARRLKSAAFRWSRPKWKVRHAQLLLEWSQDLLSKRDYTTALKRATDAESAGATTSLSRDEAFGKHVNEALAKASRGVLQNEWDSLDHDARAARLGAIASKYPDTQGGKDAAASAEKLKKDRAHFEAAQTAMFEEVKRLRLDGRVREAGDKLKAFALECCPKCQQAQQARIARQSDTLTQYAKEGFFRLERDDVKIPAGSQLATADPCRVLRPGRDFAFLATTPGAVAGRRAASARSRGALGPAATAGRTGREKHFLLSCQGMLLCFASPPGPGGPAWGLYQGLGLTVPAIRVGDDVICVHHYGRRVSRLEAASGRPIWSRKADKAPIAHMVGVSGGVAILDQAGTLRILAADTGQSEAEYALTDGRAVAAKLASDGHRALALITADRVHLFEAVGGQWYRSAVVLLRVDAGENVFVMSDLVLVTQGRPAAEGKQDRLYLWRDRHLTPVTPPDFGAPWRLAAQDGQAQVWLGPDGTARLTWVDKTRLVEPLHTRDVVAVEDLQSAALVREEGTLWCTLTGPNVRHLPFPIPGAPAPGKSAWLRSVPARQDTPPAAGDEKPPVVRHLRILDSADDKVIAAGTAEGAVVVAGVSREPGVDWLLRLGPAPTGRAVPMGNGTRVWSDGWGGLWSLRPDGTVRHTDLALPRKGQGSALRIAGGGGALVAFTDSQMQVYDESLRPQWPTPLAPTDGVAAACLEDSVLVYLDGLARLKAVSAKTGKPAALPAGVPDHLIAKPRGQAELASCAAGLLAATKTGWVLLSPTPAHLPEGLSRLVAVGREGKTVYVGSDSGELACWNVGLRAVQWHDKGGAGAAPILSVHDLPDGRLVTMSESGELQFRRPSDGTIEASTSLDGVPTAPAVRAGSHAWVPLDGSRLVRLPDSPPGKALPSRPEPAPATTRPSRAEAAPATTRLKAQP